MNNTPKFVKELALTIIVAALISIVLATLLGFISGNLALGENGTMYVNAISNGVFGLIVGYKLSTLVRQHKK